MRAGSRRFAPALLLIAILALGCALRLYGLGRQSLWYDEGVSAYLTTLPLGEMTRWTAEDIQPPLYYYLLAGWAQLFGRSEAALRGLSALFSVITVALAWWAGRRLHSARAGALAALFFAVSPLYLWYAQEARNYALLTCLGLLASLLFYDLCDATRPSKPALAVAYALACIAALYTHYFAIFLLAAHALYYVATTLRRHRPTLAPLFVWLTAGVAYLPWLPYQLGRLGADESYWRGTLKLDEALREALISFSLGETILEQNGWPWALGFLGILAVCVVLLLLAGRRRAVFFLALYLLIPVAGVLALALRVPKFNVRYLMPASPAYLLLLACGLAEFMGRTRTNADERGRDAKIGRPPVSPPRPRLSAFVRVPVSALLTLFLLAGFARSDLNLYRDAAFSKADFRGVAATLRDHRQPDEAVILLSGHMFPVFDYYLPGGDRLLLPAERTLSTERVVTFEMAGVLREALAGKAGVWVVRWQDEVADPNGVLEILLDAAGQREPQPAHFWQVRLDHYRLPAGATWPTEPPISQPAAINFGGLVELAGWSQARPDEYVLYWRALQPIPADLAVSLRLLDTQGILSGQADGRPSAYLYPTTRWKVGEITPGRARAPALPGIPPGDYTLEIRMYAPDKLDGLDILDAAGAPQGKTTRAGPFELAEAGRTRDGATLGLPIALDYQWDGRLALGSMSRLPASVAAGETFLVELGWRGLAPTDAAWSASLRLQPAGRDDLAIEQPLPLMQSYPTNEWLAGEWLRGRALLRAPASWPAGPAEASLRVQAGGAPTTPIRLGQVQVRAPAHDFTPPALATRLDARSGPLRLVGYRLEPQVPTAGAPVTVTLTWQTNEELSSAYTAFAQLLGADGKVVAQYDRQPAEGGRPTTGWVAGEFIADSYRFGAWPAGGSIVVGLYEAGPAGLRRLTWTGPAGAALGDALRLTP